MVGMHVAGRETFNDVLTKGRHGCALPDQEFLLDVGLLARARTRDGLRLARIGEQALIFGPLSIRPRIHRALETAPPSHLAKSCSRLLKAFISIALPDGSRKNFVAFSPDSPFKRT